MAESEEAALQISGARIQNDNLNFSINVQGEEIKVDSDVLKANSDYFECMLHSDMKEAQESSVNLVEMDKRTVQTLIDYMCGEGITMEWEDVMKCVDVIEIWQMKNLRDQVAGYISSNIHFSNFKDLQSLAEVYNMVTVLDKVKDFISSNFDSLLKRKALYSSTLEDLKGLIPPDVVCNISCEKKLKGCLSWIQHHEHQQECHVDFMNHFDLGFHDGGGENFFRLLCKICTCRKEIKAFKGYESVQLSDATKSKLGTINEGYTMVAMGVEDQSEQRSRKLLKFDFAAETMEIVGTVPKPFEELCTFCHTPYGLFLVARQSHSLVCGLLDIHTLNYIRLQDLPLTRMSSVRAVFRRGLVYVFGHCDNSFRVRSLKLDGTNASKWKTPHYLIDENIGPTASFDSQPCKISDNHYILCAGVCFCLTRLDATWYISKWKPDGLTTTTWNGCILSVGNFLYTLGSNKQGSNTAYDRLFRVSRPVDPSSLQWSGQCSVVYLPARNAIVLCGDSRPEIELYDLTTRKWRISKLQMPFTTSVFAMAFESLKTKDFD